MLARRIVGGTNTAPAQNERLLERSDEAEIRRLRWWELRARERVMKVGGEMVRQELFSKIYDSPLGLAVAREVRDRLHNLGGGITEPIYLSKIGNNVAIEVVDVLSQEDRENGVRSLTDPDFIYERGGLCVEMSMVAEVAMHLAYSLANPTPDFSGSTQEVVLRTMNDEGVEGHHAVLKVNFVEGDGTKHSRCCDPVNGIECSWEDFMSGSYYSEFSGRPTELVFMLDPIEFA